MGHLVLRKFIPAMWRKKFKRKNLIGIIKLIIISIKLLLFSYANANVLKLDVAQFKLIQKSLPYHRRKRKYLITHKTIT